MNEYNYEMICGLEIHVELNTKTKVFCSCETSFGAPPNTHCCPICMGMPGTLPSLNKEAVNKAVMIGLALNCQVNRISEFDRKNYFYPDLVKAYQLTQHYKPLCLGGSVLLEDGQTIRIKEIHIEEDAGKIVNHDGKTLIDYNRSGIPLVEIVSEPDIRTPMQAKQYVEKIQMLMRYINVSDCKMQEGSMRCDVNVSVRRKDSDQMSAPVEIKNLNSKNFVRKALEYEFKRQIELLESNKKVLRETRRYNEKRNVTELLRRKESERDYRYFRDPDLPSLLVDKQDVLKIQKTMPQSFDQKLKMYVDEFSIPYQSAKNILKYKKVADFFDIASINLHDKKIAVNLILGSMFAKLHGEAEKENFQVGISPEKFSHIVRSVENREISKSDAAKLVTDLMK